MLVQQAGYLPLQNISSIIKRGKFENLQTLNLLRTILEVAYANFKFY